jgi:hypothetical protein
MRRLNDDDKMMKCEIRVDRMDNGLHLDCPGHLRVFYVEHGDIGDNCIGVENAVVFQVRHVGPIVNQEAKEIAQEAICAIAAVPIERVHEIIEHLQHLVAEKGK